MSAKRIVSLVERKFDTREETLKISKLDDVFSALLRVIPASAKIKQIELHRVVHSH